MEYFLFISFFALFAIGTISNHRDRVTLYYFFVLVVALLAGLRGNQDEYSSFYFIIPSFENLSLADFKDKEPFFTLIISLFQYLSFPAQSIYLFFSSVAVIVNGYFFKKFTPFYYIAFLIYLSHTITIKEMSGLRLGYASALLLPMIYFIQKKNYFKFFIIYSLSAMVQYVGLLSIFLIFLNRTIRPKLLLIGLVIAIAINYLDIVKLSISYFASIGLMPAIIGDYVNSEYHSYNTGLIFHLKTLQQILTILFMIIFFESYKNIVSTKTKYYNLLFNAYYFGTILIILFSSLAIFAFRFSAHFMSVEPIIITYAIWIFSDKKIPKLFLIFSALIIGFINYIILVRIDNYFFLLK
ncbi:EpsG family protein [Candidatus Pseudothioglobus sp. Uisw_086]|uniref:EpsG family protein n=1 Tax=Candidatus Pseudothioglobus sp. Uisw_086 TaxID=3230998 RepID=UPI003A89D55E